jgi:hypothetical protein
MFMMYHIPQIPSLGSLMWKSLKGAIRTMEPYQPAIAAGLLLGKIGWQIYKRRSLKQEIAQLDKKIIRLSQILNSGVLNGEVAERVQLVRGECVAARAEKKRDVHFATFAFSQIPSLFFDHPGSNLYQSIHQIASRGMQMHYDARPVRAAPPTLGSRIQRIAALAASLISLAGTLASIGRMTKIIPKDHPWGHLLSELAIGVHALEGALIIRRTLKTYFEPKQEEQ